MGRLAIRKLEYVGDKYEFSSPDLSDGLVVIEGTNGSGKTTFADLIFFGLGGAAKQFSKRGNEQHREIRGDTNNYVRVTIEIDARRYSLTRRFDVPQDILVSSLAAEVSPGDVEVLPVTRRDARRIFSDWLLEKLGISVVTLFTGAYRGKLNFTDLMRLIYHDQEPDPARVFMKPDRESFVTDSRDFRRAVFEILVGSSSERYYDALGRMRAAERRLSDQLGALAAYKGAVAQMAPKQRDANAVFLRERIAEREGQLSRLQGVRRQIRKSAPNAASPQSDLTLLRSRLASTELALSRTERRLADVSDEKIRLYSLEEQLVGEVVRIQKIIHAHETLSLFSPDTCPCCLRRVDRVKGHCICGQEIGEEAYQRFFYSSEEYLAILKSKQKNVETVSEAKTACEAELQALRDEEAAHQAAAAELRQSITKWAGTDGVYGTQLEQIDDEVVEVRVELERLRQQLDMELERNKLEIAVSTAREELKRLVAEVQRLELEAEQDKARKVARFDAIYSNLMQQALINVRTARLDSDYEPILDEGDYREASATVTRRLMYFLTLLQLSLEDSIPFPRFLLIDTPETAGIDQPNVARAIGQIPKVLEKGTGQVILTTGPDRYPPELQSKRVVLLTENTKLLRPKSEQAPPVSTTPEEPWSPWEFEGEDLTDELTTLMYDDLVGAVHDGDYPVGYTELDNLVFRHIDREAGTAELRVSFNAEHHREDISFDGHVEGVMNFDSDATTKKKFLESVTATNLRAHFDMD